MRHRYYPLVILALPAILSACTLLGGKAAEEPAHRVVLEDGPVQVREYQAYAVARTTVRAPYREATRIGFRRLFEYITGANRAGENLEMTAPVVLAPRSIEMEMTAPVLIEPRTGPEQSRPLAAAETWTIAFVLPDGYTAATAPAPKDERITLADIGAHRIACIVFSGRFDNETAEASRRELQRWLAARGLAHAGDWQMAGYNPPWTLPGLRRNEVIVSQR